MGRPKSNRKKVTLSLTQETWRKLKAICEAEELNATVVMQKAIGEYYEHADIGQPREAPVLKVSD